MPPAPPRPHGLERNVVITEWDWADPKAYLHDEVSTDRRNPTLNANGLIYGSLELSADYLPVLNPATNSISQVKLTVRDPNTPVAQGPMMLQPSPFWGTEAPWVSRNNVHNPMFDERGRVWITSTVRPPENPDFCKAGSALPSAKAFPLERSGRQLAMYDPASGKLTHISTCFSTHHLMFAEDANRTLWTSGGGQVVGWLNTKMFDETGDEQKSQGWTALIMDTNGNGKRDAYVEPGDPVDPTKDKRFGGAFYAVSPAPDGSIWGSVLGFPGRDRPAHAGVESAGDGARRGLRAAARQSQGSGARLFAARHGCRSQRRRVGRAGQRPSGQLRSAEVQGTAERTERNGPALPRGLDALSRAAAADERRVGPGSAESSYYTWVDQFDTLGLGANTPIDTGNESEGLLVLKDGKWVVLRVPYPVGYYTKWMDGRIDDPKTGWKGRGLYSTVSTRAPFHMETGKGTQSKVIRFQMRPDPLAK